MTRDTKTMHGEPLAPVGQTNVYWHVWAGSRKPWCDTYNGGSIHEAVARGLYTRYKNKGCAYVELAKREWVTSNERHACNSGCCRATLTTVLIHEANV